MKLSNSLETTQYIYHCSHCLVKKVQGAHSVSMSPGDGSISGPIQSFEFENKCTKDLKTPLLESVLRNEPGVAKNCPTNKFTWIKERKRDQNSILPIHTDSIQAMLVFKYCKEMLKDTSSRTCFFTFEVSPQFSTSTTRQKTT